jgi:hypothetical protein
MGTRNLQCVVLDGEYKVAQYSQWDGYLEGQGNRIVDFIVKELDRNLFVEKLRKLSNYDNWTDEQFNKLYQDLNIETDDGFISLEDSQRFGDVHPELCRDTGADIFCMIQDGEVTGVKTDVDFANDSLWCEYCYVLNLDDDTLEVYEGFVKSLPLDWQNQRFYSNDRANEDGYYPVKFVASFDFDQLRCTDDWDEFVEQYNQNRYGEEDDEKKTTDG